MPYVLGLVAGISIGLLLSALIVIKMIDVKENKHDYLCNKVESSIKHLCNFKAANVNYERTDFEEELIDTLFLVRRYLNKN